MNEKVLYPLAMNGAPSEIHPYMLWNMKKQNRNTLICLPVEFSMKEFITGVKINIPI